MSPLIYLIVQFLFSFVYYIHSCHWSPIQCGCARQSPSIHHRIVGGTPATPHSWPWIVSVRKHGSHICGGVIITNRHVLTAAHCFPSYNPSEIKYYSFAMGHHGIHEKYFISNAQRIIRHEKYNINGKNIHDIALVELDRKIDFTNSRLGFVCLPWTHANDNGMFPPIGKETWVVGWGTTQFEGQISKILLQVSVPITKNKGCQEKVTLSEKQICAGYDQGGKDSCQGDSGGPLVVYIGNGIFELVGLVSFGVGCAKAMKPGIYTRVSGYIDWINYIVNSTSSNSIISMPNALLTSAINNNRLSYTIIFMGLFIYNLK